MSYQENVYKKLAPCQLCKLEMLADLHVIKICGHQFHKECLNKEFLTTQECPTCKVKIIQESLQPVIFDNGKF